MKIFRTLRAKMIKSNKVRNYLLYAVGEIFLVTVGILIALQVNTWNDYRKERNVELEILHEISTDLADDLASLNNDRRLNKDVKSSLDVIESALRQRQGFHDSLGIYFGNLAINPSYSIKTSGYENLKNRGVHIIENDTLRKSITSLYKMTYPFLKERQQKAEKATSGYFEPRYNEFFARIIIKPLEGDFSRRYYYIPADFNEMAESIEFQRLLDYARLIKDKNLYDIEWTLRQVKATKEKIDNWLTN